MFLVITVEAVLQDRLDELKCYIALRVPFVSWILFLNIYVTCLIFMFFYPLAECLLLLFSQPSFSPHTSTQSVEQLDV